MAEFNAEEEARTLKQNSLSRKTKTRSNSKLRRYDSEILALRKEGCSYAEIQRWLKKKRLIVAHSTVARWIKRHG